MPFALVFFGLVMVITGAKGSHVSLGNQLVKDFTGQGNFVYWFLAMGVVGGIGYIRGAERLATLFQMLIITGMLIKNGGFFTKFFEAIQQGPEASARDNVTTPPSEEKGKQAAEFGKAAAELAMFAV